MVEETIMSEQNGHVNGNNGINGETPKHYNDWPNDHGFDVYEEETKPVELKVSGNIPPYAAGVLYRTGPGGYKTKTEDGKIYEASHWFDGFSQVHRFQILPPSESTPNLSVMYNSRHSVDGIIDKINKTGKFEQFTFGQKRDPCQSLFKKIMTTFSPPSSFMKSNPDEQNLGVTLSVNMPGLKAPVSSANTDDKSNNTGISSLLNKSDNTNYQFIDPATLEPIGLAKQADLHPDLKGPFSGTHAKQDPLTGDIFNYNLDVNSKAIYRVWHVSASTGKTTVLATITDAPPAYIHSIFLTANHVILCVWGSHLSYRGLAILYYRNMVDSISPLDPAKPCRWYVIPRSSPSPGVIATYTTPAFFAFHTVNAYEIASPTDPSKIDIMADIAAYDDLSVIKRFYYDNLKSSSPGSLAYVGPKSDSARTWLGRYRLPNIPGTPDPNPTSLISAHEAVQEFKTSIAEAVELPTLNPNFMTRKHRYVYGVADRGKSTFFDGLVKYDTQTRTPLFWEQQGHSAGEAIFVANPDVDGEKTDEVNEDRGVLLSVVLNGHTNRSYLLVLDARDMTEVGRAEMEGAVGFGFHGTFVGSGRDTFGA